MKLDNFAEYGVKLMVAPLAGAWIETRKVNKNLRVISVAPLAGAWIETSNSVDNPLKASSRPSRARGLKHFSALEVNPHRLVAPLAGAWIETNPRKEENLLMTGRAPRGRVD